MQSSKSLSMASMLAQTILTASAPSSGFQRLLSPQLPYHSSFRGVSLNLPRQSFSPFVTATKHHHHHHRQPLPIVVAATKNDASVLDSVSNVEDYDVVTLTQEDGGGHELWSITDDEDGSMACVAAVPKKRTSKSKTRIRKNIWKRKAYFSALKALSLAKSIYTGKSKSFLSDKLKKE